MTIVETTTCSYCSRIRPASKSFCSFCGLGFEEDTWVRECPFGFSKGMKITETGLIRRPASFLYENLHPSLRNKIQTVNTKKGRKTVQEVNTDFKLEVNFSNGTIIWKQNKFGAFDPLYANIQTSYHGLIHYHDKSKFPEDQEYTTIIRFTNGQINDSDSGTPALRVYAIDRDNFMKGKRVQDVFHDNGVKTKVVDYVW